MFLVHGESLEHVVKRILVSINQITTTNERRDDLIADIRKSLQKY